MATNSKWTAGEDSILVEAVLAAGSRICWNTIAERLPGRSNKSCRKRWIHSLDPSLRKGRWTTPEDALLITAVRRHGRHWYKVAELLPGRTDDQCAKRWREKLDPLIR
ncbi:putative Myb-like protein A [Thelephora ganbajun]|uniref:Myb-like protein A n=1 Tax=Thelephora ganbajun TaxID=370292 RepID=A0ACB6ZC60_THEGA|nr:putative Myb-like protein A [Thelephora ganbajun]